MSEEEKKQLPLGKNEGYYPVIKLVSSILVNAIKRKATKILIEPQSDCLDILYEIDEAVIVIRRMSLERRNMIVSRIKIMACLDIAEQSKHQQGSISLRIGKDTEVHIDISISPTQFGEKAILILKPQR